MRASSTISDNNNHPITVRNDPPGTLRVRESASHRAHADTDMGEKAESRERVTAGRWWPRACPRPPPRLPRAEPRASRAGLLSGGARRCATAANGAVE